MSKLLDNALQAHELGLYLVRVQRRGKRPASKGWTELPRQTETEICGWVAQGYNVGIRTGPNLFAVDIDPHHGGTLEAVFGETIPVTVMTQTGGGGLQLWFTVSGPCPGNSAGKLAVGIDTRGVGGQVLLPGCTHPSGNPYRYADGLGLTDVALAPLPGETLKLLLPKPRKHQPKAYRRNFSGDIHPYARRALERETELLATAPEGTRNNQLFKSAASLFQLVGGGELPGDLVESELRHAWDQCHG